MQKLKTNFECKLILHLGSGHRALVNAPAHRKCLTKTNHISLRDSAYSAVYLFLCNFHSKFIFVYNSSPPNVTNVMYSSQRVYCRG